MGTWPHWMGAIEELRQRQFVYERKRKKVQIITTIFTDARYIIIMIKIFSKILLQQTVRITDIKAKKLKNPQTT